MADTVVWEVNGDDAKGRFVRKYFRDETKARKLAKTLTDPVTGKSGFVLRIADPRPEIEKAAL